MKKNKPMSSKELNSLIESQKKLNMLLRVGFIRMMGSMGYNAKTSIDSLYQELKTEYELNSVREKVKNKLD